MKELLERAIELAVMNHKGQVDKGGKPYILHPLAVMHRLKTLEEKIVGVCHDLVEDTNITFDDLRREGFPEHIIEGIASVTRMEGEERAAFLFRAKNHSLGRKVKIADIKENSDLSRIPNPTERDKRRLEMYQKELRILTEDEWFYNKEKQKWYKDVSKTNTTSKNGLV